jgi:murein DD-endopeptidase MepM/ murein hydrolase activator NlpD
VVSRRASSRWVHFVMGVVVAAAGLATVTAGESASAATVVLATAALPLPTSLPPLPTPPLLTPLPTLPLPTTLPSLPLPTLPTSLPPVSGLPGQPGALPPLLQSPGSTMLPGGADGVSGDSGSAGSTTTVQTSVLGALLALLGTPANVGVEQPSLEHFDINAVLASRQVAAAPPSSGHAAGPVPALLWGLTIACLLGLVVVAMLRQHRRRPSRLRSAAAAPLVVLVGVLTVTSAQNTWFPTAPASAPTGILAADAGSRPTPTAATAVSSASAQFNTLMTFETQVAQTEARLLSPPAGLGSAQLRNEHSLAISLEATLQHEYDFFVAIAKDPAQAAALLRSAAAQPATVRNAVTYDVDAVQVQLAQEAAIGQAAQSNSAGTAIPAIPANGAALPVHSSPLAWPLNGVITQGFGPSQVAIEPAVTLAGITYPHFHTGIDIASALGTPVQAAADGVVALAGAETDRFGHLVGYGNYVVIAHGGGVVTLYGHLEQVLVHPGQAVHAGDPIGLEGSTGNSTGPHVHFELRIQGIPTDPTSYVQPR